MNNQGDSQKTTRQSGFGSGFGYLVAGLGIGAALTVFFAPQSGEKTRKWVANKCLDAADTANDNVRQSRIHLREVMDRGQQQISEAVAAGREAIGHAKAAAS